MSWARSRLSFSGVGKPTLRQWALTNTISFYSSQGWNVGLGGGAVLGGEMSGDGFDLSLDPGWLVSARAGLSILDEAGAVPFLSASVSLSYSQTRAEDDLGNDVDISALDYRLGLTAGYTLFDAWQIYVAPSIFKGGVTLDLGDESITGSDRSLFQVGFGTSVLLPGRATLFAFAAPLGEQSVSAGLAFAF